MGGRTEIKTPSNFVFCPGGIEGCNRWELSFLLPTNKAGICFERSARSEVKLQSNREMDQLQILQSYFVAGKENKRVFLHFSLHYKAHLIEIANVMGSRRLTAA